MSVLRRDLDEIDVFDIVAASVPRLAPTSPGVLLRQEWLEPLGITAYRLAKAIALSPSRLTAILAEERAITADTALRLARYFGADAQSWMNLQVNYDLEVERRRCA